MRYEVCILSGAEADATEIFTYIAQDNKDAAIKLLDNIYAAMEPLCDFPERGARIKDKSLNRLGYRFLVVGPYLIFYRVVGQEVHVHHIVHERRNLAFTLLGKSKD